MHLAEKSGSRSDGPLFATFGSSDVCGFDPSLTAIGSAYAAEPRPAFSDPPIDRAGRAPCGDLDFNGRINRPAIRFAILSRIEVHS
jgi:hypothetical protein